MIEGEASAPPSGERGLVRVIGSWGLAAAIVNVTIGGGIFRLPAGVAAEVGAAAPLAYLDLTGAVQLGDIVYRFARRLGDSPTTPTWNADAEFRRTAATQP